jgi:hypothetical protein
VIHHWQPTPSPSASSQKGSDPIDQARTQETLNGYIVQIAAITAQAEGWKPTCEKAAALKKALVAFADPPQRARRMVAHANDLLQPDGPPADADAIAALQKELDDQAAAIALWRRLDDLAAEAQRLYDDLQRRPQLDADERHRLERHNPQALRDAYLEQVETLEDLRDWRVGDRLREHIRVLSALDAANPAVAPTGPGRRGVAPAGIGSEAFQAAALVAETLPDPRELEAEVARRGAAQFLAGIARRDKVDFAGSLLIAAVVFLATIYPGDDFGSTWDYVQAFAAGAGGTLVVNWALLPWYRSYRPAPAEKADAA